LISVDTNRNHLETTEMINDNGIAWMIAGGAREFTRDDQRQVLHRIALSESTPSRAHALRKRIAGIVGGRAEVPSAIGSLSTDCCPA
jgi:hypothetical protein